MIDTRRRWNQGCWACELKGLSPSLADLSINRDATLMGRLASIPCCVEANCMCTQGIEETKKLQNLRRCPRLAARQDISGHCMTLISHVDRPDDRLRAAR